ncbi:MAG: Uma2 family endonuclease [Lachnospiraceae bacterium]|nr:Uma2 family endonuclease [Lachnospiraceae bacterium]
MKNQETKKVQDSQNIQGKTGDAEKKGFIYEEKGPVSGEDLLGEAGMAYAFRSYDRQGEYTLEDYYALPDEQRVELIDGVFYDMAAPYTTHQIAIFEICTQLGNFIKSKKGSCRALPAPTDVQLDCDDRTMLQPDVLVVCDRDRIRQRCIYGAPDFVIEILSDLTARKDATVKLWKYRNAGVREYWIVDLRQEKVIVYDMTGEDCRTLIYGIEQPVPVQIFDGECQIYFNEICEEVSSVLK